MADKEDLRAIVYPTLWPPITVRGVPRDWLLMSVVAASMVMVAAGLFELKLYPLYGVAAFGLLWVVGYAGAYFDPEFFTVIVEKSQIGATKSSGEKGGNEYLA